MSCHGRLIKQVDLAKLKDLYQGGIKRHTFTRALPEIHKHVDTINEAM
jgi:hypothetical protein